MRLLVILFSLPSLLTAAGYADTIDYASSGSLAQHNVTIVGSVAAGQTWSVTDELVQIDDTTTGQVQQGNLGTVDITTGTLVKTSAGFSFTGGSVDIVNSLGKTILDEMFSSGTVTVSGGNTFLNANLMNGGTTEIENKSGVFSSNTIVSAGATVPEPASLTLLGSGLCGLWWFGREYLKKLRA